LATAEATLAWLAPAEPMTAVDIGASVIAQPAPMARNEGSSTVA